MKKRWMFLIAELAAMIIIEVIRKLQYRKESRKNRLTGSPEWVRERNRKELEEMKPDPAEYHSTYKFEPPPFPRKDDS